MKLLLYHDRKQALIEEDTSQIFSVPGKTVMLSAYNGTTDIAFCFLAEEEIAYDRRKQQEQKRMIRERFEGLGWRTRELLDEMSQCGDFYFAKLCQVRMESWTKGRVAEETCISAPINRSGSLANPSKKLSPTPSTT